MKLRESITDTVIGCAADDTRNNASPWWQQARADMEARFGAKTGDWVVRVREGHLVLEVRSGSWEGILFVDKVAFGIRTIKDLYEQYLIEGIGNTQ